MVSRISISTDAVDLFPFASVDCNIKFRFPIWAHLKVSILIINLGLGSQLSLFVVKYSEMDGSAIPVIPK